MAPPLSPLLPQVGPAGLAHHSAEPGQARVPWARARAAPASRAGRPPTTRAHSHLTMSNSPSQRFARPLIARAGAASLSFPSPQTGSGAPRRRQPVALARRDHHACEAWRAPCEVRTPLGAPPWRFWAGGRASVSGIASGECVQRVPRSQVIVPGGRGPEPPEPAVTSRSRGTPPPAPPSGSPLDGARR